MWYFDGTKEKRRENAFHSATDNKTHQFCGKSLCFIFVYLIRVREEYHVDLFRMDRDDEENDNDGMKKRRTYGNRDVRGC